MNPIEIAQGIALILFVGGGVFVAGTLARGLAARWSRPRESAETARLQESVQRLSGELGDVHERVTDLQERVDFAERLLARQRDAAPLKGGE